MLQILILFFLPTLTYGLFGSKKNVTVLGQLDCGGNPYAGVTVELWDDDTC